MAARCLRCLLPAFFAVGLHADNQPVPATPVAGSALAAAKRDYEIIQRAQTPLALQQLDGPAPAPVSSVPLPPAGDAMGELNSTVGTNRPMARPAQSSHWLLDAMTGKELSPLEKLTTGGAPGETGFGRSPPSGNQRSGADSKNSDALSKPGEAAINPLTSFMNSWMTPRDLELLKVKADESSALSRPARTPGPGGLTEGGTRGDAAEGTARMGGTLLDPPITNPYLLDLGSALNRGAKELTPLPVPANPRPLFSVPRVEQPPVINPQGPFDLFKPQDDSKYFPQLKRF